MDANKHIALPILLLSVTMCANAERLQGFSSEGGTTPACLPPPVPLLQSLSFCTFIRMRHAPIEAVLFRYDSQHGTSLQIGLKENGIFVNVFTEADKKKSLKFKPRRHRRQTPAAVDFNDTKYMFSVFEDLNNSSISPYFSLPKDDIISAHNEFSDKSNRSDFIEFTTLPPVPANNNSTKYRNEFDSNEKDMTNSIDTTEKDSDNSVDTTEKESGNSVDMSDYLSYPDFDLNLGSFNSSDAENTGVDFDEVFNETGTLDYDDETHEEKVMHVEVKESDDVIAPSKVYFFEPVISPQNWHHICVSYNTITDEVHCHIDGLVEELSLRRKMKTRRSKDFIKIFNASDTFSFPICVGSSKFLGEMAHMEVFNTPSPKLQGNKPYYPCGIGNGSKPTPTISLDDKWKTSSEIQRTSYKLMELCDTRTIPMVLYRAGGYDKSSQQCRSFGGTFPNLENINKEKLSLIQGVNGSCRNYDSIVSWLHTNETKDKIVYHECRALSADGTTRNVTCVRQLACSLCLVRNVRVTLYGHKGAYFDHYYHLTVKGGEAYWLGPQRSEIKLVDRNWVISSPLHLAKLYLANLSVPIGRHFWSYSPESNSSGLLLTMSRCKTFEFSCNDGSCIDISKRCDDLFQCEDLSDELNCDVVKLASSYNSFYEPPPRPGESFPTSLFYDVEVYHLAPLSSDIGKARMDVALTVSWFDPRLDFTNLKLNRKNYFHCEKVWIPSVRAVTGQGDGSVVATEFYEEQCFTIPKEQEPYRNLEDPWMGHSASGLNYPLEYHAGLLVEVPCQFYLIRYPFDSQRCNVSFMVMNAPGTKVFVRSVPGVQVHYFNRNRVRLEYELKNLTTDCGNSMQGIDNNTFFLVTYHLERMYGYHIMNSFFPSLLMALISYSTFYFQINDFYDRVMVALTSHFILASQFIAATKNSTKTPYMKMIDIWYAGIMTYCFFVIVVQVAINGFMHCWDFPKWWGQLGGTSKISAKIVPFVADETEWNNTNAKEADSATLQHQDTDGNSGLDGEKQENQKCSTSSNDENVNDTEATVESTNSDFGSFDFESCGEVRNRNVAGRNEKSTFKKCNINDVPPSVNTKANYFANNLPEVKSEIDIIVSEIEEQNSTVRTSTMLKVAPQQTPRRRGSRLPNLAKIPVSRILPVNSVNTVTVGNFVFPKMSEAKRNLNKVGPRMKGAACANLMAKFLMFSVLFGFVLIYFMAVNKFPLFF